MEYNLGLFNLKREDYMPIAKGISAPEFSLPDATGTIRNLSDYRGNKLILYFYPKDDTPGCTTEACNFRDDYSSYVEANVMILGVSPDSVKSHKKFKEKYKLPFPLLADEQHTVCETYGVWGKKSFMGKEYLGVSRTTFVISEKGTIVDIYYDVKPAQHSAEIINSLK
jgi:thioredoxin-dependent peroxiredoxin